MTCAQGLLRLLWGGGPEVGVLRDCQYIDNIHELRFVYRSLCIVMQFFNQINNTRSKLFFFQLTKEAVTPRDAGLILVARASSFSDVSSPGVTIQKSMIFHSQTFSITAAILFGPLPRFL